MTNRVTPEERTALMDAYDDTRSEYAANDAMQEHAYQRFNPRDWFIETPDNYELEQQRHDEARRSMRWASQLGEVLLTMAIIVVVMVLVWRYL